MYVIHVKQLMEAIKSLGIEVLEESKPTILDVTATVSYLFRWPTDWTHGKPLPIPFPSKECQHVIIIIVDALGVNMLNYAVSQGMEVFSKAQYEMTLCTVYPSKTPVVVASLATGLLPEKHGVRTKEAVIKHQTLLDICRKYGIKTATAARVTSSVTALLSEKADVKAVCLDDREICLKAKNIIKKEQPGLFIIHFLDIDNAGHKNSPFSQQVLEAIKRIDDYVNDILNMADEMFDNYITFILADHGMHSKPEGGGGHGTLLKEDMLVPLKIYIKTN